MRVDIRCDPTQIDHTGLRWTFLDEAAHPERIVEGAIVITGDAEDPVFARVASLTERREGPPRDPARRPARVSRGDATHPPAVRVGARPFLAGWLAGWLAQRSAEAHLPKF